MYSVQIEIPLDILQAINEQISATPRLMQVAYDRATQRLRSRWKQALQVEPPAASNFYPIHWQSAKQRRAFFATNGFGGGIPHIRTHELSKGWQVEMTSLQDGGEISAYNEAPEATYVYGDLRQMMFMGESGGIPWLEPDFINVQYLEEAEAVLIDTWYTISDINAGVS